jgi:plasmid maintenance system antidote protein VapI
MATITNDASSVRKLIADAGHSQRSAAGALGIGERTVRRYCLGENPVPRVIILALERLVDIRKCATCCARGTT